MIKSEGDDRVPFALAGAIRMASPTRSCPPPDEDGTAVMKPGGQVRHTERLDDLRQEKLRPSGEYCSPYRQGRARRRASPASNETRKAQDTLAFGAFAIQPALQPLALLAARASPPPSADPSDNQSTKNVIHQRRDGFENEHPLPAVQPADAFKAEHQRRRSAPR